MSKTPIDLRVDEHRVIVSIPKEYAKILADIGPDDPEEPDPKPFPEPEPEPDPGPEPEPSPGPQPVPSPPNPTPPSPPNPEPPSPGPEPDPEAVLYNIPSALVIANAASFVSHGGHGWYKVNPDHLASAGVNSVATMKAYISSIVKRTRHRVVLDLPTNNAYRDLAHEALKDWGLLVIGQVY